MTGLSLVDAVEQLKQLLAFDPAPSFQALEDGLRRVLHETSVARSDGHVAQTTVLYSGGIGDGTAHQTAAQLALDNPLSVSIVDDTIVAATMFSCCHG